MKKVKFRQQKEDGSWKEGEREVYHHGNAATVLLYNRDERKVVLTKQFRLPAYLNGHGTGMLLETCAGLVDGDESPEETMKREIMEETGYAIDHLEKAGAVFTSAGSLTEQLFLFTAPYTDAQRKEAGGGLEEEGEDLDVVTMSFEEVKDLWQSGRIEDAKMLLLVQHALLKGILT